MFFNKENQLICIRNEILFCVHLSEKSIHFLLVVNYQMNGKFWLKIIAFQIENDFLVISQLNEENVSFDSMFFQSKRENYLLFLHIIWLETCKSFDKIFINKRFIQIIHSFII